MIICGQVEFEFGYVELVELHGERVELAVSLGLGVFCPHFGHADGDGTPTVGAY